jgi:hypothetical protein
MSRADDRTKRFIYHFTHLDNVRPICDDGRIVCDAAARDGKTFTEVGDPEIKESRRNRPIPVAPGGRVGDYVPFYFAPAIAMMFRIACDHRDSVPGRYTGGDRPLVYLVTTTTGIAGAGLPWVATDGNAATATTEFTADTRRMREIVDWPIMTAERWNNTEEDPDRQRRRMAEFLVHRSVPIRLVQWLGVFDATYASRLRDRLDDHPLSGRIIVRPHWYYGYERR